MKNSGWRSAEFVSAVQADNAINISTDTHSSVLDPPRLTWVVRQVREGYGLALHLVREAPQEHSDFDLLRDVLVLVGRSLKHDGNLPVHIRLGELRARLPRPSPEDDLYIVFEKSVKRRRAMLIK